MLFTKNSMYINFVCVFIREILCVCVCVYILQGIIILWCHSGDSSVCTWLDKWRHVTLFITILLIELSLFRAVIGSATTGVSQLLDQMVFSCLVSSS